MQEEAIGRLREVITESDALVIGTDDDVHRIVFALVVAFSDGALTVAAFFIMQHHLVVVVTYLSVLAIQRSPCLVDTALLGAFQFQITTPIFIFTTRHTESRLEQAVVDVDTQLTLLDNRLATKGDAIGHAVNRYRIFSIGRRQLFCHRKQRQESP